jgi:hypothetical protein
VEGWVCDNFYDEGKEEICACGDVVGAVVKNGDEFRKQQLYGYSREFRDTLRWDLLR